MNTTERSYLDLMAEIARLRRLIRGGLDCVAKYKRKMRGPVESKWKAEKRREQERRDNALNNARFIEETARRGMSELRSIPFGSLVTVRFVRSVVFGGHMEKGTVVELSAGKIADMIVQGAVEVISYRPTSPAQTEPHGTGSTPTGGSPS